MESSMDLIWQEQEYAKESRHQRLTCKWQALATAFSGALALKHSLTASLEFIDIAVAASFAGDSVRHGIKAVAADKLRDEVAETLNQRYANQLIDQPQTLSSPDDEQV